MDYKREGYWTDGYVGTYASEQSRGVYHFTFNEKSGEMTEPRLFYEAPNAKWVTLYKNKLLFPIEKNGRAGTCFLELEEGEIKRAHEIYEETQTPCYILKEGAFTYTANYHEGSVMVYLDDGGAPVIAERIENGAGAGCHQILLHGPYLMVPCLTQHRIRMFDREKGYIPSGEILFPDGSGPRHGVFNRSHTKLYVVSEWSNELFIFAVNDREFRLIQTMPLLAGANVTENETKVTENGAKVTENQTKAAAAAAVRLTGDERYLYISVRGVNLLVLVDVSTDNAVVRQLVSSRGDHPRDFILSRDERFILAANRLEGGITSMERDPVSGRIGRTLANIRMPEAVSIVLAN